MISPSLVCHASLNEDNKRACRDIAYRHMESYGLVDLAAEKARFDDVTRHDYIVASHRETGTFAGCYRLETGYDPRQFDNLSPSLQQFLDSGREVVDVGVYLERKDREKAMLFRRLFVVMTKVLLEREIHGIYIQVPPKQRETYLRLGFEVCSPPFCVVGWSTEWQAMYLRLDILLEKYDQPRFQESWKAHHGCELREGFWSAVSKEIADKPFWQATDNHTTIVAPKNSVASSQKPGSTPAT